jgi:hypothetical protein
VFLALLLSNQLPTPISVSPVTPAAAESRDDLYKKCRREVFRKYGQPGVQYNRRPGTRVVRTQFILSLTDQCVANGGRN